MVEIRLFGPPAVWRDGSPVRFDTRKAIAVLAYLSIEGSAARETLATLLWPESDPERSRATLRRTLSALRTAVGPDVVEADRHRLTITDRPWIDVWSFREEIAATDDHTEGHDDDCAECLRHLQLAAEVYRGDFLEGFSVRASAEFDDWSRTVGESYRIEAGASLQRLALAYAAASDHPAAIATVNRWLALDQLHEPAYRLLMLLNAWAGHRAGAIDAFRRCVAVLDQELGVSPLDQTMELYEAILDEDLPPDPGRRARTRTTAPESRAPTTNELLGREDELAALNEALESTSQRGGVVGIIGGSWMGKTRLMEEFVGSLDSDRVISVMGRSFRGEQNLPYGVAVQVLRALAPHLSESEDLPEWVLGELARLLPALGRRPAPADQPDRFGELRLLEAFDSLLGTVSRHGPLVITLDDAQWIDPASASMFSYAGKRLGERPILLLVASQTRRDWKGPLGDLLGHAHSVIELEPLSVEQLDRVVPEGTAARTLREHTGGLPFLVAESLALGTESEEASGVITYLESRMHGLSELAGQVLAAAAVLDGTCEPALLREVSGRAEEEVVGAVEELMAAGLLRELPDRPALGFTLEALERLAYDATSLIRRRLLHRRAAAALARLAGADADPRVAAVVAAHHEQAGEPEAAVWYRRAGDLATGLYAYSEARSFYERAISLGSPEVARIRLALGQVAMTTGDYATALRELNSAAAQMDSEDEALGVAEHRLGEVQRLLGRFDLAEEHFERASRTHPAPASLYADWALLRHRTGDDDGAAALARDSLRLAEQADDDSLRSRSHNILGVVTSDPDLAWRSLGEALRLAGDDDQLRMAALNNAAHLAASRGQADDGVGLVEEAIAISERTGHRHREAALRNHLADLHHRAGREDQARQALRSAVAAFAEVGAGEWEPEVWLLQQW